MDEVAPVWVHGVHDPLARELALALRAEARLSGRANLSYAQTVAATLAAHVVRHYSTNCAAELERAGGLTGFRLRQTIQFIAENLSEDLSIPRLAEVAKLSACHFARMFKESTGMSPHRYVLKSRISRAKQLLFENAMELAEIAQQTGFCDQGHLTRVFRQFLGTTPGAIAAKVSAFEPKQ